MHLCPLTAAWGLSTALQLATNSNANGSAGSDVAEMLLALRIRCVVWYNYGRPLSHMMYTGPYQS